MLNKFELIGRVVKDLTVYTTKTDAQAVTTLVVATNWSYKKDNQDVRKAIFHNIALWGEQAKKAADWLRKGDLVYVEGKLDTKSTKLVVDGKETTRTETILVGTKFLRLSSKDHQNQEVQETPVE